MSGRGERVVPESLVFPKSTFRSSTSPPPLLVYVVSLDMTYLRSNIYVIVAAMHSEHNNQHCLKLYTQDKNSQGYDPRDQGREHGRWGIGRPQPCETKIIDVICISMCVEGGLASRDPR